MNVYAWTVSWTGNTQVKDFGSICTFGKIINLIAGNSRNEETLHHNRTTFTILINHVIGSCFIILGEYIDVTKIFTDISFFSNSGALLFPFPR